MSQEKTGASTFTKPESITDASTAEALNLCQEVEGQVDPEIAKSIRWKIDMRLMPLLCLTYTLQAIDKNTISYAAVFGLRQEIGLKGTEFSWASAIFYLGYMFWEFPTSMLLQRLPINYFMSATVCTLSTSITISNVLGRHMGHDLNVSRSSP